MVADCQTAFQAVTKADEKIAQNGLIFIKQVWQHILNNFLHHNLAKTAGIFFIHACFNQFLKQFTIYPHHLMSV